MPKAWTNDYYPGGGFLHAVKPFSWTSYNSSGQVTSSGGGTTNHHTAFAFRDKYSVNPVNYNMGIPWRSPSDYKRITVDTSSEDGERVVHYGSGARTVYQGYFQDTTNTLQSLMTYPFDAAFGVVSDDEENRSITECLNKIHDMKVNYGQFLAELVRDTASLGRTLVEFYELIRDFRKGKADWNRILTANASVHLYGTYGIRPLMDDLFGMAEQIEDKILNAPQRPLMFSASRQISSTYESTSDTMFWTNRRQSATVTGKTKLYARLSDDFLNSVSRTGLGNPALIAWELIPFSFVIDWGLPLGNFLQALGATVGLTPVGGFTHVRGDASISAERKLVGGTGNGLRIKASVKSFERRRHAAFPRPVIYAKSPFSQEHAITALNLIAVLKQRH